MIKVVIFDLDDTLFLERDYVMSGYRAVASHVTHTTGIATDVLFRFLETGFDENRRTDNFQRLIDHFNIPADVDDLIAVYRNHTPDITLPIDSSNALTELRPRFRLGMITDGRPNTQATKLDVLGITHYFERIIINDLDLGQSKLDPYSFCDMIAYFAVHPCEAVYVGDNATKDFVWPLRLGMKCVWICRAQSLYGTTGPASHSEDVKRIVSLDELLSYVDALG